MILGVNEYQYHLTDQLGNVRVTFKTEIDTDVFTATMESEADAVESPYFYNLDTRVTHAGASQITSGNEAAKLDSLHLVGPAIALRVVPGDTIDMEVHAYYEGGMGYNNTVAPAAFIDALAGAFGGSSTAGGEAGAIYNGVNEALLAGAGGMGGSGNDNVPAAYLSYILFDQNYKEIQNGYHEISSGADLQQERLFLDDIVIKEAGYLYIYTSMQSNTSLPVYFDDLKATHTHSPVVQKSDYQAFGLEFNSYSRAAITAQNFKFNAGSEFEEMTDWYSTPFRKYDPSLGRFHGVDALADLYSSTTPSHFAMNDPINYNDPTGLNTAPKSENKMAGGGGGGNNRHLPDGLGPNNARAGWTSLYSSTWGNFSPNSYQHAMRKALSGDLSGFSNGITHLANGNVSFYSYSGTVGGGSSSSSASRGAQKGFAAIARDVARYSDQIGVLKAALSVMPGLGYDFADIIKAHAEWRRDMLTGTMSGLGPLANVDGLGSTGSIVHISVNRIIATDLSTTSTFKITTNLAEVPEITGYFLEPSGSSTTERGQDRRIPAGTYNVEPFTRPNGDEVFRIYNDQVPKDRFILIHIGNRPKDTCGCFLPGDRYKTDKVLNSGTNMDYLRNYLKFYGSKGIRMTITDGF